MHTDAPKTHACTEYYLGMKCDYKTHESWHLLRHIKTVHFETQDKKCHLCTSAFKFKTDLMCHIKMVHDAKEDYPCSVCSYTGMHKALLAEHMKAKHGITLISLINPY